MRRSRFRQHPITAIAGVLTLVAVVLAGTSGLSTTPATAASTSGIVALRVANNVIVDPNGTAMKFHGVDRSGSEYECQQSSDIFFGPVDQSSVTAMNAWNINLVRIPLNERCWLGVDGNSTTTGTAYRTAIKSYVDLLADNGIYAVLDLHWTGPDSTTANGDHEMANRTYSLPFWTSVATMFKSYHSVLFDPYNEPHDISTSCWLHGCTSDDGWKIAGYNDLISTIRATGAKQPIIVNGLDWGHDMSPMATDMPTDSAHALVVGQHLYNFKTCNTVSCWNEKFLPLAKKYPMIAGEVGDNDCTTELPIAFLKWMDKNGGDGYAIWNWGPTGCPDGGAYGGSAVVSDWSGTPTTLGQAIKDYYLAKAD